MNISAIRHILSQELGMILAVISVVIGLVSLYFTLKEKGKHKWSVVLLLVSLLAVTLLVANYITVQHSNNTPEEANYTVSSKKVMGDVELSYSESIDLLEILIKWEDNTTICDSMIATYGDHDFSEREINEAIETYPAIWRNEGITMQTTSQGFVEVGFHPGDLYGKTIYVLILNFNKDYGVDSYSIVTIPGKI